MPRYTVYTYRHFAWFCRTYSRVLAPPTDGAFPRDHPAKPWLMFLAALHASCNHVLFLLRPPAGICGISFGYGNLLDGMPWVNLRRACIFHCWYVSPAIAYNWTIVILILIIVHCNYLRARGGVPAEYVCEWRNVPCCASFAFVTRANDATTTRATLVVHKIANTHVQATDVLFSLCWLHVQTALLNLSVL